MAGVGVDSGKRNYGNSAAKSKWCHDSDTGIGAGSISDGGTEEINRCGSLANRVEMVDECNDAERAPGCSGPTDEIYARKGPPHSLSLSCHRAGLPVDARRAMEARGGLAVGTGKFPGSSDAIPGKPWCVVVRNEWRVPVRGFRIAERPGIIGRDFRPDAGNIVACTKRIQRVSAIVCANVSDGRRSGALFQPAAGKLRSRSSTGGTGRKNGAMAAGGGVTAGCVLPAGGPHSGIRALGTIKSTKQAPARAAIAFLFIDAAPEMLFVVALRNREDLLSRGKSVARRR